MSQPVPSFGTPATGPVGPATAPVPPANAPVPPANAPVPPVAVPAPGRPAQPAGPSQPSPAFVGASWAALLAGTLAYLIGLYNAGMELNQKGYYFTVLCFGLFSAVSLQKSVRDRLEDVRVTNLYFGLCWISVGTALTLLTVGLWNATYLAPSEKGFYAMAFALAMFAAVAVQKNVRDLELTATPATPKPPAEVRY